MPKLGELSLRGLQSAILTISLIVKWSLRLVQGEQSSHPEARCPFRHGRPFHVGLEKPVPKVLFHVCDYHEIPRQHLALKMDR